MGSDKNGYTILFVVAALWNWGAAGGFAVSPSFFLELYGLGTEVMSDLFFQLFWVIVFIFGFGYFMVSRNQVANRGIVWLGVIGKLGVFGLFVLHAVKGNVSYMLAGAGFGDAVFAVFFLRYLYVTRSAVAVA